MYKDEIIEYSVLDYVNGYKNNNFVIGISQRDSCITENDKQYILNLLDTIYTIKTPLYLDHVTYLDDTLYDIEEVKTNCCDTNRQLIKCPVDNPSYIHDGGQRTRILYSSIYGNFNGKSVYFNIDHSDDNIFFLYKRNDNIYYHRTNGLLIRLNYLLMNNFSDILYQIKREYPNISNITECEINMRTLITMFTKEKMIKIIHRKMSKEMADRHFKYINTANKKYNISHEIGKSMRVNTPTVKDRINEFKEDTQIDKIYIYNTLGAILYMNDVENTFNFKNIGETFLSKIENGDTILNNKIDDILLHINNTYRHIRELDNSYSGNNKLSIISLLYWFYPDSMDNRIIDRYILKYIINKTDHAYTDANKMLKVIKTRINDNVDIGDVDFWEGILAQS
jgi:hypothetical protein